jgi:hypothetical protein
MKTKILTLCVIASIVMGIGSSVVGIARAQSVQNIQSDPVADPTKSDFKLIYCDGPDLPAGKLLEDAKAKNGGKYIPCNFNGAVGQIQHLINVFIVIGILASIFGFSFAGYLYVTGTPGNIERAKGIFQKVGLGIVIMLSGWFIVYQILDWLAANSGVTALLK